MKEKRQLFRLIKTMNRGEKRAFKLFAKKYNKEDNVYIKLFDVFDKSDSPSSSEMIYKKLKNTSLNKQIPVLKNQLFHLILANLRNQARDKNGTIYINNHFENGEILLSRGLFISALNSLEKAQKSALKYGDYLMTLKILEKKSTVFRRILPTDDFKEKLNVIHQQKNELKAFIALEDELEKNYQELYYLYRKNGLTEDAETIQTYHDLKKETDQLFDKETATVKARHYWFLFNTIYFFTIKKFERSAEISLAHIQLFEEHPTFLEKETNEYLKALNNAIAIYINFEKFDIARNIITKLDDLPISPGLNNKFIEQRIFEIKYSNQLSICVQNQEIEHGLSLIEQIEKGLFQYKNVGLSIDRHIRLSFGIALLFFWKKDWLACLEWIEKIETIEQESVGSPAFVIGYAKILKTISHLELGHISLLESLVRSTKRFLNRNNRLLPTESVVIKYLEKLAQKDIIDHEATYIELEKELRPVSQSEPTSNINSTVRIYNWAKEKIH